MAPNVTANPDATGQGERAAERRRRSDAEGHAGRDSARAPQQRRARGAAAQSGALRRCRKGTSTRIDIDVVIYNGTALGVTVRTTPVDKVLNFCVERIVRDMSWIERARREPRDRVDLTATLL